MIDEIASIVNHFRFIGDFHGAIPYGFGHINDTYLAHFYKPGGVVNQYILQRINHHVFKNPEGVMQNIEQITNHLRQKIISNDGDPTRETINLIPTKNGGFLYISPQGDYWRAEVFIEGAQTYQSTQSLELHYNASKAFGKFQKLLVDFLPKNLNITIPDFHDTHKRYKKLLVTIDNDVKNRAILVKSEIDFLLKRADQTAILKNLLERGEIPERVTHNDTKFDNVMIDDITGDGICVIDLDTVMPGLSLYDFGDLVRFGANTATEDESDLSKVTFNMEVFDRILAGFLEEAREFLTSTEVNYLAFSAKLITLEQGIRFLSDYLNGDVYYKINRIDQNKDRCCTQLKLVSEMEKNREKMEALVEHYR